MTFIDPRTKYETPLAPRGGTRVLELYFDGRGGSFRNMTFQGELRWLLGD